MSNDDIRIGGKKLNELKVRERVEAQKQIQDAEVQAKRDARKAIIKKYNRYDVVQLEAAIRKMEANIENMKQVIARENAEIKTYRQHISNANRRDQELASAGLLNNDNKK
jgi:hypothetical protein